MDTVVAGHVVWATMMPSDVPLRTDRHHRLLDQTLLNEPDYRFLHEFLKRADTTGRRTASRPRPSPRPPVDSPRS